MRRRKGVWRKKREIKENRGFGLGGRDREIRGWGRKRERRVRRAWWRKGSLYLREFK